MGVANWNNFTLAQTKMAEGYGIGGPADHNGFDITIPWHSTPPLSGREGFWCAGLDMLQYPVERQQFRAEAQDYDVHVHAARFAAVILDGFDHPPRPVT